MLCACVCNTVIHRGEGTVQVFLKHGSIAAGDALDPSLWKVPNQVLSLSFSLLPPSTGGYVLDFGFQPRFLSVCKNIFNSQQPIAVSLPCPDSLSSPGLAGDVNDRSTQTYARKWWKRVVRKLQDLEELAHHVQHQRPVAVIFLDGNECHDVHG